MNLSKLNTDRVNVTHQLRQLSDDAADAGRGFTAAEETRWSELHDQLDRIDARMALVIDAEERAGDIAAALGHYGATEADSSARDFFAGNAGRSIDLPVEQRDVLKSGSAANTVPAGFVPELMTHLVNRAAVAGIARVVTTPGGNDLKMPTTTAHSTAALVAEGASIGESDPTFSSVTLGAYKFAHLVQVSSEAIADTGVPLESYIAQAGGEAVGNALGAYLVTGTGSSQPQGVVTGATSGKTTAGATAITYGELVDLVHSVLPAYRVSPSAGFLMNDSTVGYLRKLLDNNGLPIWQESTRAGEPSSLLGYRVTVDPNVAAIATGAKTVLFGDWSRYVVRIAGGVRIERSDDYAFNNDLATFRIVLRADGRLADTTGAIKFLTQA